MKSSSKVDLLHDMNSPLGVLRLTFNESGIRSLDFVRKIAHKSKHHLAKKTEDQLEEYFLGKRLSFDLPIDLNCGTEFQNKVWSHLQKIPYGKVLTYQELAVGLKCPQGQRAVGGANGKNPLPIIIPCHRVVSKSGLGGYSGGIHIKEYLLKLEKSI